MEKFRHTNTSHVTDFSLPQWNECLITELHQITPYPQYQIWPWGHLPKGANFPSQDPLADDHRVIFGIVGVGWLLYIKASDEKLILLGTDWPFK